MKRTRIVNEEVKEMNTWEFKFSKVMTEHAIQAIIELYQKIGAEVEEVIEYCRTHEDIKEHIDAKFIAVKDGLHIEHTWQIKVLSQWNYRENFTIEFFQNRHKRVFGEVSEIKAKFYFHSYYNENKNYIEYHIINVAKFKEWFFDDIVKRTNRERASSGSNASFFYIPYEMLSKQIVVGAGKFLCVDSLLEQGQEVAA